MSRFEGEFEVAGAHVVALPELLELAAAEALPQRQRQAAIACYLSASDGWRDAGNCWAGLSPAIRRDPMTPVAAREQG